MEQKHVRLHLCVYRAYNLSACTESSESFSFKRVHRRILRAASINSVTQNGVCWRRDVAEWDLNLCGLDALIRPLSWWRPHLSFCINSRLSRLTSSPPFPPPFCFISSLSCSVSPFTFLPSDPFFFGFQGSASEIEQFFTFTPLPPRLDSVNIQYIFTLTCIV